MDTWSQLKTRDVMSSPVSVLRDDATLLDAARLLSREGIKGAPVVSASDGRPVGILTLTDLLRFVLGLDEPGAPEHVAPRPGDPGELRTVCVDRIMTRDVIFVAPDDPVRDVALWFCIGRIHHVLVLRDHQVVGIVTPSDIQGTLSESFESYEDTGSGRYRVAVLGGPGRP